jgi:two-component system, OmpR family, phosphate regulon sensor histidine kinase PhoR
LPADRYEELVNAATILTPLCLILTALALWLYHRLRRAHVELARTRREQQRQADELSRLRELNAPLLDLLPDPTLVLDDRRQVLRANQAAEEAFGPDISAVLRHPGLRLAIERGFRSGEAQMVDLALPVPVPRDVQAHVLLVDRPMEDRGRAVVILSDRTREKAAERSRADFVANASHELRTPLASLIGFIDTLRGPAADDPPTQQRFLGIMAEQAFRMQRLIDDLLSLSRIELAEHQPPREPVDLAALIRRVLAGFEPRIAAGQVELELELPEELVVVNGDADQLVQVLQNLVDNGLKYGADGRFLRVRLSPPQPGERWPVRAGVVFAVTDRGPGIPPEHLPRLTERFYRVDKGRSRAIGGTGLGLAIVKHIVNRHRGQLVIQSEVGVGTTVRVWLPASGPAA